jgi:hypothetical protein
VAALADCPQIRLILYPMCSATSPTEAELSEEEIAEVRTQVAEFHAKEAPEASRWQPPAKRINSTNYVANAR